MCNSSILLRTALALVLFVAAAAAGACTGDDDAPVAEPAGGASAFDPTQADALAHAALPKVGDLPGGGWQAGATDLPAKDTSDLDKLLAAEPSCAELAKTGAVQLLFGGGPPASGDAGRAEVNFAREPAKGVLFQTSAQVDIEVKSSRADADAEWAQIKQVLVSANAKQCLTKVLPAYITKSDDSGRASAAFQSVEPIAKAPRGGAALAFTLRLKIDGIAADGVMEMYFWPYSNAAVSAFFLGGRSELSNSVVAGILNAVDKRTAEAAKKP